jgi:hypothetical protein
MMHGVENESKDHGLENESKDHGDVGRLELKSDSIQVPNRHLTAWHWLYWLAE